MALSIVRRNDARIPMRTSPRDGLYALASAWQASNGASSIRPFGRPATPASSDANQSTEAAAEPPYWPDGPSAA